MSKFMNVLISVLFLVSCSNNSSKESGYTSSGDMLKIKYQRLDLKNIIVIHQLIQLMKSIIPQTV